MVAPFLELRLNARNKSSDSLKITTENSNESEIQKTSSLGVILAMPRRIGNRSQAGQL